MFLWSRRKYKMFTDLHFGDTREKEKIIAIVHLSSKQLHSH